MPEVASPRVGSPKAESPDAESPMVQSPKVESPEAERPKSESRAAEPQRLESPTVRFAGVAPCPMPPEVTRTAAAELITPGEVPGGVVVRPHIRTDVPVDSPDAGTPDTGAAPARPTPVTAPRPAGAPAQVAAHVAASEAPEKLAAPRSTPLAVTVAPDAGVTPDRIAAAPTAAVHSGVTATPAYMAATADAPVAATPNILLRPTADDGQPLESRLVELVRWQAREGGGRVEMKLRPEFLGAVTVTVHVEGGVVKASLAAESQATRDFLQAEAGHLKSALEERGFTLETFEVSDDRDSREQEQPHQRPRQQPGSGRSARAMSGKVSFGETFDVVM